MHGRPTPGPAVDDPALVDTLRDVLLRVGYTGAGVAEVLPAVRSGLRAQDLPLYDRQVPPGDPLPTLVRLFLLGLPVREEEVATALAPLEVGRLEGAHLLHAAGGMVTSLVQLLCVRDLLLLGDRDDAILEQPGWVSASSPTAQVLDFLTVPRDATSALDLGCGSGMHALLAARRGANVIAVDVDPRAIAFTRFNARLNRLGGIACRRGSWFEPVADQRFDLIVSNPPFVISPDSGLTFRDGGLPGDDVSRLVVTGAAAHLDEGAYAHVLCNWAVQGGRRWDDAPRRWLEGTGCDALVVHFATDDPLSYAATWNGPLRTRDPAAFAAAIDRWLAYYSALGITALCGGAIVMRRRSGKRNWVRAQSLHRPLEGPAGDDVLRVFEGQDLLDPRPTDDALLDGVFRLVDPHEVRQILQHRGGAYESQRCTVAKTSGLGLEVDLDPEALQIVLRLDGRDTVREIVARVASDLGFDASSLSEKACPAIRSLLLSGFATSPREAGRAASPPVPSRS